MRSCTTSPFPFYTSQLGNTLHKIGQCHPQLCNTLRKTGEETYGEGDGAYREGEVKEVDAGCQGKSGGLLLL